MMVGAGGGGGGNFGDFSRILYSLEEAVINVGWGHMRQTVEKHGEQMWREELPRGQR